MSTWHLPEYDEKDAKKIARRLKNIEYKLAVAQHSI